MLWFVLVLPLVVVGAAVLGLIALRLWRQVRSLGAEVRSAGDRLAAASAEVTSVTRTVEDRRFS